MWIYLSIGLVICLLLSWLLPQLGSANKAEEEITFSKIMNYFDNYEVSYYTFDLGSGELIYKLRTDNPDTEKIDETKEKTTYKVPNVGIFVDETKDYRTKYNEKYPNEKLNQDYYKIKDNSWLINVIPTAILIIIMVVLFFFMMKQTGGGKIGNFGRANVKQWDNKGKKVTFKDVAGADEEKAELEEIVDFLKNPKKYADIGARIPKGVLLLGPPGTGKTLLSKAVSGEAGCPFFPTSGSEFVEMFVGVGASRVRDLFEHAKKNAPSIIFIDEIDAVGRHRGSGLGGGHDEREQTLNQLLVEMDGFEVNDSVIVVAATNRRDILDPALLRPGRFDRQIWVGLPDIKGREEILRVHTRVKPLAPDVNLKDIAKSTSGFTGADLENLVNEASLLAARRNKKAITKEEIEEATIKVIIGPEKRSKKVLEQEKKLTAYHESGHAICTYYSTTQDKVHQVSIIPRGGAGGYTLHLPEHDKSFVTKTEMKENIIVLLGGRVAEKIIFDEISTGASNDIERATAGARSMVTKYGFSDKLGPIVYGKNSEEVYLGREISADKSYSENTLAEIDSEVREIIDDAYNKAYDILEGHMEQMHLLAEYLLENEKIDAEEFEELMSRDVGPNATT
ncbi:MAG: ATP-dependent zinc metalloprotease FtsH [Ruminococcus sp.]|jgi:cell division protease FtsH|nr:ATP-dependent zinc metalloprotease FtsH [Ruminococcus sp.]